MKPRSKGQFFIVSALVACFLANAGQLHAQKLRVAYSSRTLISRLNEKISSGCWGASIATYDLAIQDPVFAKKTIGKYTRTTDPEALDASYKENVKDYALRIPYVSAAGLTSIFEFRAESAAAAKNLALEKMYDNSLL